MIYSISFVNGTVFFADLDCEHSDVMDTVHRKSTIIGSWGTFTRSRLCEVLINPDHMVAVGRPYDPENR